jgi:hypothetical protein
MTANAEASSAFSISDVYPRPTIALQITEIVTKSGPLEPSESIAPSLMRQTITLVMTKAYEASGGFEQSMAFEPTEWINQSPLFFPRTSQFSSSLSLCPNDVRSSSSDSQLLSGLTSSATNDRSPLTAAASESLSSISSAVTMASSHSALEPEASSGTETTLASISASSDDSVTLKSSDSDLRSPSVHSLSEASAELEPITISKSSGDSSVPDSASTAASGSSEHASIIALSASDSSPSAVDSLSAHSAPESETPTDFGTVTSSELPGDSSIAPSADSDSMPLPSDGSSVHSGLDASTASPSSGDSPMAPSSTSDSMTSTAAHPVTPSALESQPSADLGTITTSMAKSVSDESDEISRAASSASDTRPSEANDHSVLESGTSRDVETMFTSGSSSGSSDHEITTTSAPALASSDHETITTSTSTSGSSADTASIVRPPLSPDSGIVVPPSEDQAEPTSYRTSPASLFPTSSPLPQSTSLESTAEFSDETKPHSGPGSGSKSNNAAGFGAVGAVLGVLIIAGVALGFYLFRKPRNGMPKSDELDDFSMDGEREEREARSDGDFECILPAAAQVAVVEQLDTTALHPPQAQSAQYEYEEDEYDYETE